MYVSEFLEFWPVTLVSVTSGDTGPTRSKLVTNRPHLSLPYNVEIYLECQSPWKLFRCVLESSSDIRCEIFYVEYEYVEFLRGDCGLCFRKVEDETGLLRRNIFDNIWEIWTPCKNWTFRIWEIHFRRFLGEILKCWIPIQRGEIVAAFQEGRLGTGNMYTSVEFRSKEKQL